MHSPRYKCPKCGRKHDYEQDALDCCEERLDRLMREIPGHRRFRHARRVLQVASSSGGRVR